MHYVNLEATTIIINSHPCVSINTLFCIMQNCHPNSTQERFQSRLMVVGHTASVSEGMEEGKGTREEAPMEIDPENAVSSSIIPLLEYK